MEITLMKIELRIGLLLNALGILAIHFQPLPGFSNEFICGLFIALGIFSIVVAMLPKKVYNNLAYRKLLIKGK